MVPKQLNSKAKKILIVDDHPISREGLVKIIGQQPGLECCGEADSMIEAVRAIKELEPDVVIVDISLKDSNGIELTKNIKTQYPKLPVLICSMHDESLYGERSLHAGASGYVMKQEEPEEILKAIRQVLRGEIYVSDNLSKKLMRKFARGAVPEADGTSIEKLSDRELEVFQLIGEGFSTREIAKKLYLSTKTVDTYRAQIKQKLNLANSSELLRYTLQYAKTDGVH